MSEEMKTSKDFGDRESSIWDEINNHYEGSKVGSAKLMALHDYKDFVWAEEKHKGEPDDVKKIIRLSLVDERISTRSSESEEYSEEHDFIEGKANELRRLYSDQEENISIFLAQSLEETYYKFRYPQSSDEEK